MKTFKEVDVIVTSEITPLERSDGVEKTKTEARAFMKVCDQELTISYLEEQEGARINTDIEIKDGAVTVKRHGAIESEFVFESGKEHSSLYVIPPYRFDAKIKTKRIRNELTGNGGTMTIFYDMTVGGDARAVKMRIEVYIP